jgi:hypothetical protein
MKTKLHSLFIVLALFGGVDSVIAQNTVFTYQGRLLDNGTNFTGTGLFQFALVTSTNANQTATATATNPVSGFITTINVTFGGSGYLTAPAVTIFGGGGSGATATATISNGVVTAVNINPGGNGSGYTSIPNVTIASPPPNLSYSTYWSNDGTSVNGSQPTAIVSVGVTNGLFTVVLGDSTIPNMGSISAALFNQPNLQLQIWFNDGTDGFAALSPAQSLTPMPYAVFAGSASNLLGTLPAAQLSGTVASGALPPSPIFSGTVTAGIFSGSGTNLTSLNAGNLASGTVPLARLGGITSTQLDAVTWQLATNLNGGNAALASNLVAGIGITNAFITNSIYAGNGGGLTNLNASKLTSIGNTNVGAAGNFFVGPAGNSTVSGFNNTATGVHALAAVINGNNNTAGGYYALQANTSGGNNTANGYFALYSNMNGGNNTADGLDALYSNTSGNNNTASGYYALFANTSGSNNIALGYQAGQAIITGSSNIDIGNVGQAGDANIIRIGTSQTATYLAGTVYGNNVQLTSDRNAKENFQPVDNQALLAKVASLPVSEWNYKTDSQGARHIGPMAQDFQAAFQLSADDQHISVVDEGGVALAAIQGLNQKLNEKVVEIQRLEKRLDALQTLVKQLAEKK